MVDVENIPVPEQDLSGITKIISSYEGILTNLKINLLAKRIDENEELVEDKTRRPLINQLQERIFFSRLESAISTPVRFSQHEHEQARQILLHNLGDLRFDLYETGLDINTVNALVEIYRTLATATINGSIDGFTLHQITEHMNISELRTTGQDKKGGFRLPNLFKHGKGEEDNG